MSEDARTPPLDIAPIRFQPSMEQLDQDEAHTNAGLIETITAIQQKVYSNSKHARRGVHAKCHGVLVGELRVLGDLPTYLSQGLFSVPKIYPVVLRLSTIPGDVLDDEISVPRALAIKVIGVPGSRVSGSEGDTTQDSCWPTVPPLRKRIRMAF